MNGRSCTCIGLRLVCMINGKTQGNILHLCRARACVGLQSSRLITTTSLLVLISVTFLFGSVSVTVSLYVIFIEQIGRPLTSHKQTLE